MNQRNEKIKEILPTIEFNSLGILAIEEFQNNTLRPILKFQNELLLSFLKGTFSENKIDFNSYSEQIKIIKIKELFKLNFQLKQVFLGFIIAFFTTDELHFYFSHKKEINKRISSLLIDDIVVN